MQLLAALLTDAGWRPLGWERMKAQAASIHDRFESSPGGVLGRDLGLLLRSGDRRWQIPSRAAMQASTIAEARDAGRSRSSSPAGSRSSWSATSPSSRRSPKRPTTFGTLAKRVEATPDAGAMAFPPPPPGGLLTLTHKGRDDQAVGMIAWPTTGYSADTRQLARTLTLYSARCFNLRLTDEVREKEGISYSPFRRNGASSDLDPLRISRRAGRSAALPTCQASSSKRRRSPTISLPNRSTRTNWTAPGGRRWRRFSARRTATATG